MEKSRLTLLLGSNLGEREQIISKARESLVEMLGEMFVASSIYESEPWGDHDQPAFLNQAIVLNTESSASQALAIALNIENELGRVREESKRWGSRLIDIDLLFYEDQVMNDENLTIPHPRIQERRFVLEPLAEIIPNFMHPTLKVSIEELLKRCTDVLNVKKIKN